MLDIQDGGSSAVGLWVPDELSSDEEADVAEFVRTYLRKKSERELEKGAKLQVTRASKRRPKLSATALLAAEAAEEEKAEK
eukprot:CAMPEP_0198727300 /NCGR_PEP_ID=MMETSP1475-20131203/4072_1 /TAXON_ID= ORGANISM="Unidentified sp., Strain CCMP1999" /NCGR_SAMPLE_ID=MMETSP1475 /ASSEMBLY_ACC=CAM_ASM_001111 /LENGTH=80 /DNA_ID=CAMNT_0044489317 /DNA_START=211 /DNA_END=450 /DNA_ORIENTATION=+